MNAAFFDTNIIFYAASGGDRAKRETARGLLQSRRVVVSTQVLMETYASLLKKLKLTPDEARLWVDMVAQETVLAVEPADVIAALDTARRFEISHWDGLILQAAGKAGLSLVYSEDLNHGQMYGPVRVCNPFIEDFLA
ncbi:PIN domain-containing protein [Glycocaulis abyssi]|uniref:Ribonuclease VapC n=1 Tax=Glycocaulis abyssi TaxID=1433403 RepID=A0ABV9NDQ8_9PROT